MKTGIKEQSTKYVVNSEKGVVVCIINGYVKINNKSFEVRGISRCHKDDKFDEVKGRRLAESRAKQKMFKFAKKTAEDFYKEIVGPAHELVTNFIKSNTLCYESEVKHALKLLK